MRIAYILSGTQLDAGSTKSFLALLRGLVSHGHDALVICPDKGHLYSLLRDENNPAIRVEKVDYTYSILPFLRKWPDYPLFVPRLIKRYFKNRRGALRVERLVKDFGADLIHTNTSVNNVGYLAARKLRLPHIWHIREYGKSDFGMIVPNRRRYFSAPLNYKICITEALKKFNHLEFDPTAKVIYNGIIDGEMGAPSCQDKDNYFFYAGRVTSRKGVPDMVKAYAVAAGRSDIDKFPSLYIAGRPDEGMDEIIHNILTQSEVPCGKVKLLGEVSDVKHFMRKARAVIIPSLIEGFGRVMPEAMSVGTLVIGRNTGGTREQFDNGFRLTGGEIGWRFNAVDDLSDLLEKIGNSGGPVDPAMVRRAYETVAKLYTVENNVTSILDSYSDILTGSPKLMRQ